MEERSPFEIKRKESNRVVVLALVHIDLVQRKSLASKKISGRSLRSLVIERYQRALPSATACINSNDQREQISTGNLDRGASYEIRSEGLEWPVRNSPGEERSSISLPCRGRSG